MALRHSPKRTIRPAQTQMRTETAEAESTAQQISRSEVAGESEADQRGKTLLGVCVDRPDDPVDLVSADNGDWQFTAEEQRVLHTNCEVGADQLLVSAQRHLVDLDDVLLRRRH